MGLSATGRTICGSRRRERGIVEFVHDWGRRSAMASWPDDRHPFVDVDQMAEWAVV